jgi:hypothetical protein
MLAKIGFCSWIVLELWESFFLDVHDHIPEYQRDKVAGIHERERVDHGIHES